MKVQMPESVDVFAFVTADLAGFIAVLGGLCPRTVDRPAALTLEEPVALHPAQQRDVGRQGTGLGLLLHHHRQVVKMELVTPTGMLPVLLAQQLDELGSHRGMLPVVGADLALERLHRPGLGAQGLVIPALDRGKPQYDPFSGDGVAPLPGGQLLELGLELAWGGRRGQKQSDNAEAKMRPPFVGAQG